MVARLQGRRVSAREPADRRRRRRHDQSGAIWRRQEGSPRQPVGISRSRQATREVADRASPALQVEAGRVAASPGQTHVGAEELVCRHEQGSSDKSRLFTPRTPAQLDEPGRRVGAGVLGPDLPAPQQFRVRPLAHRGGRRQRIQKRSQSLGTARRRCQRCHLVCSRTRSLWPQSLHEETEIRTGVMRLWIPEAVERDDRRLPQQVGTRHRPVGNLDAGASPPQLLEHHFVRGQEAREVVVDVEVARPLVVDVVH